MSVRIINADELRARINTDRGAILDIMEAAQ